MRNLAQGPSSVAAATGFTTIGFTLTCSEETLIERHRNTS
jgi:hypothetical protein